MSTDDLEGVTVAHLPQAMVKQALGLHTSVAHLAAANAELPVFDTPPGECMWGLYLSHTRPDHLVEKGAARLLTAYETFGSIVIIHPDFAYMYFKDSRRGPYIGVVSEGLGAAMPTGEDGEFVTILLEQHDHKILGTIIKALIADRKPLLECLRTVEQMANTGLIYLPELPQSSQ
ncbi:hypothetical protein BDV93DRAFT_514013 [Ceratobasidium sp. AG-I]|nr:hypothetical protein BDV93DRAFT_514013 [Ceratobasidium sp. AG-I]